MHTTKSLKNIKKIFILYFHTTKIKKKYVLTCMLSFNNQFIKIMRIMSIFQKYQKNYFFLLVFGITNLYVRCISDIKKVFPLYIYIYIYIYLDIRMFRLFTR